MLPFYDLYPHRVERVTSLRHAVKWLRPAPARCRLVNPSEIITKMSRKLFFLLSPSAVLFYFLFTVRVPHKKTINLLFTDHQEIVSRRGLFTTHVRLVADESKWCTLYDWRDRKNERMMIHFYLQWWVYITSAISIAALLTYSHTFEKQSN